MDKNVYADNLYSHFMHNSPHYFFILKEYFSPWPYA